jgi:hypothetical protein
MSGHYKSISKFRTKSKPTQPDVFALVSDDGFGVSFFKLNRQTNKFFATNGVKIPKKPDGTTTVEIDSLDTSWDWNDGPLDDNYMAFTSGG